ncbi:MAG: MATE family efflux transporter [Blautia sp.]|nr:MATE family efflux transporter [Blautia sp.]
MEMSGKKNLHKYEIDMINGSLMPKLVTFFVPLMLSSALQLLFNAVDLMVVGKWAGSDALAAVGATTALINMFSNMMMGIAMGSNVVVARFIALEDKKNVSESVHTSVVLALILGFLVMVLGLVFSRGCLALMGTPDNVLDQSVLYMRIYFCGVPFFALYNYGAAILRAAGDTRRPLFYLIFSGILNAVLNMILVIAFHLDVAGVAIATVFSQMISCILVLRCVMNTSEMYKVSLNKLHINGRILKQIFAIGVPTGIQSTVINFSNVLLQSSVNSFGSTAMAGYTAANNFLGLMYASVNSVTQACMSFTSQNYAVGRFDRVRKILRDCLLIEFVLSMVIGGAVYIFAGQILKIYTNSGEVIRCGVQIFNYTTVTYFLCGFMDCIPGALRGLGHSAVPMLLAIIGTVGSRVVWIFFLFPDNRTLDFLFISYPVSWGATVVLQAVCLVIVFKKLGIRRKELN